MKIKNKIWLLLLVGLFITGCEKSTDNQNDDRQSDGERYINQYQFYVNDIEKAKDARNKLENVSVNINAD